MMKYLQLFFAAAALAACQATSWAQAPGIVYPAASSPAASAATPPRPAPTAAAAASKASTADSAASQPPRVVAQAQRSATPAASGPAPSGAATASAPAPALSVAPPNAVVQAPRSPAPAPSGRGGAASDREPPGGESAAARPVAQGGRPRSASAMAQAEERVASQMTMPVVNSGSGVSRPQPQAARNGLASLPQLPAWAQGGLARTTGQTEVAVAPNVTEVIKIARVFPNRLQTPFEAAEVVTTAPKSILTHDTVGGDVVLATNADTPIGIFVRDLYSDRAIPIVLVPDDVPQRQLRLVLDSTWPPPVVRNPRDGAMQAASLGGQSEYVDYIKATFRALAMGDIPDGHAATQIVPNLVPACQMPGLNIRLGQMFEGTNDRIGVYVVSNEGKTQLPVQENGCYRTGVLAAAPFPRPVLEPGQSTELYVLVRKERDDVRTSLKRRPALVK